MKTMTKTYAVPALRIAPVFAVFGLLAKAWQVTRERQALARLDERALRDIGVTPEQAGKEASRPVWDLPIHR